LSTLTKVLIILQVVVVLILCGLVVTYVATSDNYMKKCESAEATARRADQRRQEAEQELEKTKAAKDQEIAGFRQQIAALNEKMAAQANEMAALVRERDEFKHGNENMAAALQAATNTATQQTDLYKKAQERVEALSADQIKKDGELGELRDSLAEKTTLLNSQAEQIKNLTSDKTELQGKLDQVLRQAGRSVPPPAAGQGSPQKPASPDSPLKGSITRVDLENKLAEISIGSASGVKPEMKFYVIRGSQFICNLLILEVKPQAAVGLLDMVQQEAPKVGDEASTSL
jgi:hypothetical protein